MKRSGWCSKLAQALVLVLAVGCIIPAHAARSRVGTTLEERIRIFSKALDLDAKQQVGLRKVLQTQREEIRKIWEDPSVPAAYRIVATQAVSDQTADRIRALLNDEQKKKYNPPRQSRPAAEPSSSSGVEAWMSVANPKPETIRSTR